eukprot:TRINITY_DN22611_c0_g1_i1.p1 TRINITY_DN22611_c0_g1~~TRINITY_DN22611_c0_g1_i1.p1  ORF type:complete len:497 (+),score=104.64 TRINITY_DN22611_c0_g1_i1:72-1493(+)
MPSLTLSRRTATLGLAALASASLSLSLFALWRRRRSRRKETPALPSGSSEARAAPSKKEKKKQQALEPGAPAPQKESKGKCPGCNNTFAQINRHIKKCQAVQAMNSAKGGLCPGCNSNFPNLMKHMRRCCPERLPRSEDAGAVADQRKAQSPDDWLDSEDVAEAAIASFAAIADPLQRRALELRFGVDRGGQRRSPAEVGAELGGKYAKNAQTAQVLIRTALKSIPLVADDPTGLEVIYEDDDLLAVGKPPFLRTNPVHRFCGKSLTNMLVGYLKPQGGAPPPYIIHRLDQNTSGVFLCTKTAAAAASLQAAWHGPECSKEYLALVHVRKPPADFKVGASFVVDVPIGRDTNLADDVKRSVDFTDGQTAKTRFEVLALGASVAIVSATLVESGRTHQIRVHASHSGLPLVGDGLYGGEEDEAKAHVNRVALHAWRLRVVHPTSREQLLITAPLPADLDQCRVAHGVVWPSGAQ